MRISDWSSDVCSSDLLYQAPDTGLAPTEADWQNLIPHSDTVMIDGLSLNASAMTLSLREGGLPIIEVHPQGLPAYRVQLSDAARSEEHTSELQSLMRISYAVFCLKKKKTHHQHKMKEKHNNQQKSHT